MPDYTSQIYGDPNYISLRNLIQAQSAAEAAQRRAAVQQAVINYGAVPQAPGGINSQWWSADLPSTVGALADQNTAAGLSTLARLARWNETQTRQIQNGLAARGMMQSGELGYQLGEQGLGYRQQQYDAAQDLLAKLFGVYSSSASNEQQRQMQLAQLAMQVAGERASNPAYYTGSGGGGSSGGGSVVTPPPSGTSGAGGSTYLVPSAADRAMMDRYDGVKSYQRPSLVRDLYRKYEPWRLANPGWNTPSPGGVAP